MPSSDSNYMNMAFEEAKKAYELNEVPIGAIIVKDNTVIAKAHNIKEQTQNPLHHAENICIEQASNAIKSWRLINCRLYTTLEPCCMCAGSIIQARIPVVIFGAYDPKGGGESVCKILSNKQLNHSVKLQYCEHLESQNLLKAFFKHKRKK